MINEGFTSLLAKMPQSSIPLGLAKQADVESADEMQLEQDFAHLAYTFLQDRAGGLIPYILGFEVVDREEDGSKAVGIFGFKIGKDFYYVPSFWVNNQVKGMDLLYNKKQNSFVPLRESWINHIVNKQTIELGKTVEAEKVQADFENPNFDFLVNPPVGPSRSKRAEADKEAGAKERGKRDGTGPFEGSAQLQLNGKGRRRAAGEVCPIVDAIVSKEPGKRDGKGPASGKAIGARAAAGEACPILKGEAKLSIKDAFATWNDIQAAMLESLDKDADFQHAYAGAICAMTGQELPYEKTAENSDLLEWISKRGGIQAVNSLMQTVVDNPKFASAALTFYPSVESLMVTSFAASLAPKTAAKITVETSVTDYGDSSDRGKKRIVRDGFTIKDPRPEEDKSEVYDVNYESRFSTPDRSGTYDVLLRSGGATQAWVFLPSSAGRNEDVVIVEPDKRFYATAEADAIYVRGEKIEDGPDPYEAAVALTKMTLDQKYILIDEEGHATGPVEIRSSIAENGKRIKYRVYWTHSNSVKRPTYGHDFETLHKHDRYRGEYATDYVRQCGDDCDYIQIATHNSNKLARSGTDTLVIPANWKALKLWERDDEHYETERVMKDAFEPGSMTDIFNALIKEGFHKLSVCSDDGLEYYFRVNDDFVDGSQMGYKQAYVTLVSRYGLSVDDADDMLKEAREQYKSRRMVKIGQLVGVNMPQMNVDDNIGTDDFSGAQQITDITQQQQGQLTGAPEPQDSMQPGFNIGGEAQMDQEAAGLAGQAAQAGQKQIFDHAAIGGLARVYDAGSVVDSYIPQLMQSLDRVGRILFLFYWKNEEFADRYGTEDLAEMEDTLRGVFKSFGDLVLQLREKTIDSEDADSVVMSN